LFAFNETEKDRWEIASSGQGDVKAEGSLIRSTLENATDDEEFPFAARNAAWSGGLAATQGQAYWKILLKERNSNCVEVGLADRQKFKTMKVWKCLALIYRMGNQFNQ